jgi:hypothetical protein
MQNGGTRVWEATVLGVELRPKYDLRVEGAHIVMHGFTFSVSQQHIWVSVCGNDNDCSFEYMNTTQNKQGVEAMERDGANSVRSVAKRSCGMGIFMLASHNLSACFHTTTETSSIGGVWRVQCKAGLDDSARFQRCKLFSDLISDHIGHPYQLIRTLHLSIYTAKRIQPNQLPRRIRQPDDLQLSPCA